MTSVLKGRKGGSQFLTKGREVAWIWYCTTKRGRGVKNPTNLADIICTWPLLKEYQLAPHSAAILGKTYESSHQDGFIEFRCGQWIQNMVDFGFLQNGQENYFSASTAHRVLKIQPQHRYFSIIQATHISDTLIYFDLLLVSILGKILPKWPGILLND